MSPESQLPFTISAGATYSNGAYGRAWGVRQVIEFSLDDESGEETVAFKGIAGACRRKTGNCTLDEFRRWVRYEVALNENSWQRIGNFTEDWPDSETGT
jgi:hypothetical protein